MTDPNEPPEATFGTYLAVLRRRKWWVISFTLLGLVASLGYSLIQPKAYSATAQLLVKPENASITNGATPQAITPTDVLTELQLVTSAPVKAAVGRKLGSVPSISVAEVGQTNVIAVTGTAANPAHAASIANAYANAFVTYQRSAAIDNLTAAETQLSQQISTIDAQAKSLESNPAAAAQVTALLTQEAALKEQLAQLQVSGAVTTGGVQVVTPATAPSAPSSPKPSRNAVLGFILGLLFGIGVAFVVEHLDDTVYEKEELERLVPGTRVLALIPMVGSWKNKGRTFVVTRSEPNSIASEAYRSLRTSLQFIAHETKAKVMLVTSPTESEGKTTTVANLGVVLANAGERVAIVSCDLRHPRVGSFLGLNEQVGLTAVLLGQRSLDEVLQAVPGVKGLSMLATGERPSDPTGVLSSDRLAGVLDDLRQQFDVVLVDSPPVLPVTDAAILAQAVDATLLVVAAEQTRRKDLRRAIEALSLVQATVVGVVLNEVTMSTGYGYGKRSGYSSYAPTAAATNGNGSGG
jgi:capsular exopolysaccharide synthesis family protein